ncbi:hypothetical protein LLH00_06415 [bacterium]|nr:hypothetical protein [bacterium]
MEENQVIDILANVLASNDKWRKEVESNIILQNTLEELFSDPVFVELLQHGLIPKFQKTYLPHFRAVELILAVREVVRQMYEENAEAVTVDRQLEDFQLKITDKFELHAEIDVKSGLQGALKDLERLHALYRDNPQFSARLDIFRLLVLPLEVERDGEQLYQLLVLENIRPPRQAWAAGR